MRKVCCIIVVILAVVCAGIGISGFWEEYSAGREYEQLRKDVRVEASELPEAEKAETREPETVQNKEVQTEEETATEAIVETGAESETESESKTEAETESETETETEKEPVEIPIDFEALQKRNPDVYAWIQVEGTEIDYPILQHSEDNLYYLNHTIDGKEAVEGAIYTEDYNSKDFEDPNTVIYGHNMKNGSMFRGLHDFSDKEFFDENRDITIYLPDEIRHYEIFAAYVYDSRHILQSFDFSNERVVEFYHDLIFSIRDMEAHIDTSMEEEFDKDSKIITLSTCYQGIAEKRYLVQALLVSVEK